MDKLLLTVSQSRGVTHSERTYRDKVIVAASTFLSSTPADVLKMDEDDFGLISSVRSDMSEEEIQGSNILCEQQVLGREEIMSIIGCEQQVHENEKLMEIVDGDSRPSKRLRSDGEQDEGFTLVQRKAKRVARTASDISNLRGNKQLSEKDNKDTFEVCVTSTQLLPKRIGFAKILKEEKIDKVTHIKYKNPYKVLMKFETKEEAEKLLNCGKLAEAGYRCHLTNEVDLSYGVVKYLELEVEEKELIESFSCEYKIVSMKRLKRLSEKGEWVDSETVRFCFKSPVVPTYVYGYGCRFKVDPYIFPVTQCSSCWKYGHLARACPTKKSLCPKCGENHPNCETDLYRCINCRGNHMSFDKKCPIFLKEKEIRVIMSRNNCTYKIALSMYYENRKRSERITFKETPYQSSAQSRVVQNQEQSQMKSYKDILVTENSQTEVTIHNENSKEVEREIQGNQQESEEDIRDVCEENSNWEIVSSKTSWGQQKGKARKKNKGRTQIYGKDAEQIPQKPEKATMSTPVVDESFKKSHTLKEFLHKAKNIVFCSQKTLEEKFTHMLHLCIEEIMALVIDSVSSGGLIKNLINLLHYG